MARYSRKVRETGIWFPAGEAPACVAAGCLGAGTGTAAASELEDNVPLPEKQERLNKVERLQEGIAAEINARLMDKTVEILVEGKTRGKWQGRTRTGKLVFFSGGGDCLGQLVRIEISRTSPWSLQGRPVKLKEVQAARCQS